MDNAYRVLLLTVVGEGALALLLTAAPRIPSLGRRLSDALSRAPTLDLIVALLTWIPWVIGGVIVGRLGVVAALAGQAVALAAWVLFHEALHPGSRRGPRIVKTLNRIVGRAPNHFALWISLLALPGFWLLRASEILIYPPLRWLLGFPKYRHAEWVNVSRHKFDGLVGHDLIWCLYCDWMTGVYSLGGEMLRNVESFWCPIRFNNAKKCENCQVDFPDIDGGWVASDSGMKQVTATLDAMYGSGRREWYGHPSRLTISARSQSANASKSTPEHGSTDNGVNH